MSLHSLLVGLTVGLIIVALAVALTISMWLLVGKSDELNAAAAARDADAKAEQVALDYAVGAAQMDFSKPAEWRGRLTKGTSKELTNRLTQAATSMEQIIAPLQWTSSATPITAVVRSDDDGTYVVDCFVNVVTKNTQAPEGVQSTATYSVTIDSDKDWTITDVGGIDAMLGEK
ncbi:hypothetical protein [Gordonia shandongensis]|uniref:hypothetical protein n=1 Tax=Gordonia shandongensis TaxID=376351 RepID=UPI00040BF817|nr:hypothetical protein [Gordonia shandongensis]